MTEEIVKILSVDAGDSNTSVKQLRKEIKLLKDELLNLDESSQDYNKVLGAVADRTFAMRDMNELVRYSAADLGEQIATVNRIATGLASGFGAVQGAMALFGGESETVEKTMVRLQGVIALVQGLQGLEGLTKDLKAASIQFRNASTAVKGFISGLSGVQKALLATGIGAFIAAIGALTAAYISNSKEADRYAAILDKIDEKQQKITDRNDKNIAAVEREIKLLKEQGTAEDVLLEKRLKAYQAAQDNQYKQLKAAERQLENDKRRQNEEFNSGVSDEDIQRLEEQVAQARKIYENYGEKIKDIQLEIELYTIRSNKKIEDDNKKKSDKAIELAKKQKDDLQKELDEIDERVHKSITDEITLRTEQFNQEKLLFEQNGKDITDLQKEFEKDVAEIQKKAGDEKLKEIQDTSKKILEEIENDINKLGENANKLIQETKLKYSTGIINSNNSPTQNYEDTIKYNNDIYEITKNSIYQQNSLIQEQLSNEALVIDDRLKLQKRYYDNLADLSLANLELERNNSLAKEKLEDTQEKNRKNALTAASNTFSQLSNLLGESTAEGKAAAIASTLINTYQSATAAYKALSGIPVVGPALGAAAAAVAVASGIKNVQAIRNISTDGENASSSATVYPSINIGRSIPVEYTRNLLSDTETAELNNSQRVYVLESDITNVQNKVSVVESNATF